MGVVICILSDSGTPPRILRLEYHESLPIETRGFPAAGILPLYSKTSSVGQGPALDTCCERHKAELKVRVPGEINPTGGDSTLQPTT